MKRLSFYLSILTALISFYLPQATQAHIIGSVTITPDPLDFGDVLVGDTSAPETFTVAKTAGFLPVFIFDVYVSNPTNFNIVSDGCTGQWIHDFNPCDVDVTFTPDQVGFYSASFVVIGLDRHVANFAGMEGQGVAPAVTLSRTDIDFGDQIIGNASTQPVTLTNSGTADLHIASITASGAAFSIVNNTCPPTLPAGNNCNFDAQFLPTVLGPFAGSVTITNDASDSPQTVTLSGNGISTGPDLILIPNFLDFGNQIIGTPSSVLSISVQNLGLTPGVDDLNNVTYTPTTGFTIAGSSTCGTTLVAQAPPCNLDVIFTPPIAEPVNGTIVVASDEIPDEVVELVGVGVSPGAPNASVSANSLDFGEVSVGTTSPEQSVTVTNNGGSPLTVNAITLGGESLHSYSQNNNCLGITLAVGDSCIIEVSFAPSEGGTLTANITILSDAADSPTVITLTGIGFVPVVPFSGSGCNLNTLAPGGFSMGWVLLALAWAGLFVRRVRKK